MQKLLKLRFYRAFCDSATALDKVIGVASLGDFSHVEGEFMDGFSFSISPRDKGARFKEINYNPDHWETVEIMVSVADEEKIREQCIQMVKDGIKYAYCGAALSITPFCFSLPNRKFCSRIWVDLLSSVGYPLRDGCWYTPQEFYDEIKKYDLNIGKERVI